MTGRKRSKDELFEVLRGEIFAAEMKVALDKQLGRETSDIVKRLAAVKLPPASGSASTTTKATVSASGTTTMSGSASATTKTTATIEPGTAKTERPRRKYRPSAAGRHLKDPGKLRGSRQAGKSDVETLGRMSAN